MKQIKLSNRDLYFTVDDEDYAQVKLYTWYLSDNGDSILGKVRGRTTSLPRFILNVTDSDVHIDHIDGDIFNNCRSNLRFCTRQQNMANRRKRSLVATSKFKGVHLHKKDRMWEAYLNKNGVRVYYERFFNEEEAARAYDKAAKKYFGEFAHLNFPEKKGI